MPDQSPLSLNELARRIENLVRVGSIAEVDHAAHRCRVQSGQLRTTWLPFFMRRAGNVRHWSPVSIGEQCVILSPGGDLAAGMVLVGLYSDTIAPASDSPDIERTDYPDGASIIYDHAAHALTISLPDGATADITAPAGVTVHSTTITLDAVQTTTTGALTVNGLFTFDAGMAGSGGTGGTTAVITGGISATEDITANGISLISHTHPGDSGGTTGAPQ